MLHVQCKYVKSGKYTFTNINNRKSLEHVCEILFFFFLQVLFESYHSVYFLYLLYTRESSIGKRLTCVKEIEKRTSKRGIRELFVDATSVSMRGSRSMGGVVAGERVTTSLYFFFTHKETLVSISRGSFSSSASHSSLIHIYISISFHHAFFIINNCCTLSVAHRFICGVRLRIITERASRDATLVSCYYLHY